jgi:hypothetical protein
LLDDIWVVAVSALCFVLGILVRGELSRLFKKEKPPQ